MIFQYFSITKDDHDRRLDRIVRRFLPDISLSGIYKLLRKGLIRIDGKKVSRDFHVMEGNELGIAPFLLGSVKPAAVPEPSDFIPDILLETRDLLFINKPCGISVHGEGGLDQLIPQTVDSCSSLSFRTGPLHRLDKDTTGILTFSRSLEGARWFSRAVGEHLLEKYYLGVAEGILLTGAEWQDMAEDGKLMITRVVPLAWTDNVHPPLTFARFRIITGRKHQIRIQSSRRGHPLFGDTKYGSDAKIASYFLHASRIVFPSGRPETIPAKVFAPLPERFRAKIGELFGVDVLAHIEQGELY